MRLTLFLLALCSAVAIAEPRILVSRLPEGGVQPRLATGPEGAVHLVYFQRKQPQASLGHLVYRRYEPEQHRFSEPVRVSDEPFKHRDAIARADMAVDSHGRIHVAWLSASPEYLYTRMREDGKVFARPKPVGGEFLEGIEAGPAISAHDERIMIAWHAGDMRDEDSRHVYGVSSNDGGATFGGVSRLTPEGGGVCACCGMAAGMSDEGEYRLVYRMAKDGEERHMQWLIRSQRVLIDQWVVGYCPVTTSDMDADRVVLETDGVVKHWRLGFEEPLPVRDNGGKPRQKHPAIAVQPDGTTLIGWGEAGGYVSGGRLSLQLLGPDAEPLAYLVDGSIDSPIPDYSTVAVAPLPDGNFLLVY